MGKGISGKTVRHNRHKRAAHVPYGGDTAVSGLSQAGFQVLGILIAGLILWLFVGTGWPSFLVLMALMTVPGLGSKP